MKRMNNKGFAVSVVLYASATIIVLVLLLILSVLSTTSKNTYDLGEMVKEQVSGVTGTTYQLRNLVINSSFENDGNGWTTNMTTVTNTLGSSLSNDNFHYGNKSIRVNPRGWQYQKLSSVSVGDKLYVLAYANVRSVSGTVTVGISNNSLKDTGGSNGVFLAASEGSFNLNRTTTGFERISAITTVGADSEVFIQVGAAPGSTTDSYIDDILVLNLTKTFGAGQEPSLSWCDNNIKYFNSMSTLTIYDN